MTTANTATYFAALGRPTRFWHPQSPAAWTCIGGLAIPLWATWPALSLQTRSIPTFECITIIFTVSWLAMLCLERRSAAQITTDAAQSVWLPAVAFAMGEAGATVFFVMATHYIGAAEANLISYLWPGLTVGLGAAFGVFHLKLRHLSGIVLGFAGAATLFGVRDLSSSQTGIALAMLGALSWAGYCVFRLAWTAVTQPILARGFGLSAILCALLHLCLEHTAVPTAVGASAAVAIGLIPGALANWTWDEGFRRGDSRLLAVMAYATPLCSTLLLAAFGFENLTSRLLVGAILIALAGILSRGERKQ
jgi:drug/metabolite transporter (DMT)-like permease